MPLDHLAKLFLAIGTLILCAGGLFYIAHKLGVQRIPGDIKLQGKSFTFYFPIVSCLILSVILTILLRFFGKN